MHRLVDRREFVRRFGKGALACSVASLAGCWTGEREPAPFGRGATWSSRLSDLEQTIPQLMEDTKTPGLSIAIIRDARVEWARGFGLKDRASRAPVDDGTIFEAASMSKPVFAYAVMNLCERGIMDLDTPLVEYTPDRFLVGDSRLDAITARHVLSHTAGFQNVRSGDTPLQMHFTPGTKWMYSGEGYAYLQSVVAHLTGVVNPNECSSFEADLTVCATDFDAYMKANLLAPLGMNSSGYLWTEASARHVARPHDERGEPLPHVTPTAAAMARYGAMGGLHTTAIDYAKFLVEVIDPKPTDAFRLSQAGLTQMLQPQIQVESGQGDLISWALGWRVAHTAQGDLIGHGGDQRGFHSTAEISVSAKSGYVILTNGDYGWKLIQDLAPEISQWVHTHGSAGASSPR